MNRFSMWCGLAWAALTLLATCTLAYAGERPFNASIGGVESYYSSNLYGRGEIMHLGRSTLIVGYMPPGQGLLENGIFLADYGYLISADGDRLNVAFDAFYYEFDPAVGVVNTTVTFAGGTGRFQDATGAANVRFVFEPYFFDYGSSNFRFQIDGSINY